MKRTHTVVLLGFLGIAQCAFADCTGTNRPATAAEKAFDLKVKGAIKEALPPAPPGWQITSEDKVSAEDFVCVGDKNAKPEPVRITFRKGYLRMEGQEERERLLMAALQQALPTPQQQAKLNALMKRQQGKAMESTGPRHSQTVILFAHEHQDPLDQRRAVEDGSRWQPVRAIEGRIVADDSRGNGTRRNCSQAC